LEGQNVTIPPDYAERVYAGMLGKLIGVYLGRPVEGWTYERIAAEFGEIDGYVPDRRGAPLVVTDDDVTGTITFLRALEDEDYRRDLTPAQIGNNWLNYTIEKRTIFWWGGLGNSTEHTAYLRLKSGVPAPLSGAVATNGKTVAEQIGAQIFIDGWAMVAPGDPELAADLARRAGSVSHDGEAVYAAQVIAAMEALAFVEPDPNRLLDAATALIPPDSTIRRLIADVRDWHAGEPDWRETRRHIAERYGYDRYLGACHVVPNHALIHLSLLYGGDDFRRALTIVTTSGWDTDCNAANVGCLLGIKNGLAGIDDSGYDWRGPVADRLYLPTADGGRAISDAATETIRVVNAGRALAGKPPVAPKSGARFHFALPGSVQGFRVDTSGDATVRLENVPADEAGGERRLAIRYRLDKPGDVLRATTPTFVPPEARTMPGYELLASPTLYPGQTIRARVLADAANVGNVAARLVFDAYGGDDQVQTTRGEAATLVPGGEATLVWPLDSAAGHPICAVGVEIEGAPAASEGTVFLDWLTWDGAPRLVLDRPAGTGRMWLRAWVDGVDDLKDRWSEPYRLVQNVGTGVASQGTREWTDVRVEAPLWSFLMRRGGIAVRVQGMRRFYSLLLCDDGAVRLVKARDGEAVLAEAPFAWEAGRTYRLGLQARGRRLDAWLDGRHLFTVDDTDRPLLGGAIGLVCTEGCLSASAVAIRPADAD
jgi:ADP-ribosylglycohydrolase